MKFSFSGRHMEIGEALTNKANEACLALAAKYSIEFLDVSVVMTKDSYLYETDISIKTNTGNSYHASISEDAPILSFEKALQKIDLQIQKKKKVQKGVTSIKESPSISNVSEGDGPIIIAEILDDLPLLSVSEASQKLSDERIVFIFENISNNAVNVVYKRPDGNIGWLDYQFK